MEINYDTDCENYSASTGTSSLVKLHAYNVKIANVRISNTKDTF